MKAADSFQVKFCLQYERLFSILSLNNRREKIEARSRR